MQYTYIAKSSSPRQPPNVQASLPAGINVLQQTQGGTNMSWLQKNKQELLHYNMTLIGGISGAYALLVRSGNFGAAETTNLIELVLDFANQDITDMIVRVLILFIYSSSIIAAHLTALKFPARKYTACLTIECICVLLAGLIPVTVNPLIALYPIFAMSAFQWQTFTDASSYNSSTIFSTNNLKQALLSWTNYRINGEPQQKTRAIYFTLTLAVFHTGVLLGWFAVRMFSEKSIWITFLPFAAAFYYTAPCRKTKRSALSRPKLSAAQE